MNKKKKATDDGSKKWRDGEEAEEKLISFNRLGLIS